MKAWDIDAMDVRPGHPEVVVSTEDARVIALHLESGQRLDEHQVHERAWVVVARGRIAVEAADGRRASGGPGFLAEFDPHERHQLVAEEDSRIMMLLTPWPGDGHPSERARRDPTATFGA